MIKLNRQQTTLAARDGMAIYFHPWSCANKRASLALQAGDRELMLREQESSDCLYSLYERCKQPAYPVNLPDGVKFWGKQDGAPDWEGLYLDRAKHIESAMNSKPVSMPDYLSQLIYDDDATWRDKVADWLKANDDRNLGYNHHRLTVGSGETSLSGEIEVDYFISEENSGRDQYWTPCYVVIDGSLYDLRDSSIAGCDILSDTLGWYITDMEGEELPPELSADRAQLGYGSNPNNKLSKLLLGDSKPVWHFGLDCFVGRVKGYPYPVKIFVDHPFYSQTTMEHLIAQSLLPVSTDTLSPDHLCEALLSEADYLGITIERKLWQIATAIAAHGRYGGICLDLPPKLEERSSGVVSELFDALNDAAPSGCFLGACEGDAARFLWTLTIEAQCAAIDSDPNGKFEAKTFSVPEHWLSALVNGDESGLDDRESEQLQAFCKDELSEGWHVASYSEESEFSSDHDATSYGVLACQVVDVLAMRPKQ